MIERGTAVTIEEKHEPPQTQTAGGGSFSGGGRGRKAPPRTPFRKRKVGDRVRVPGNRHGTIVQIRSNGHDTYLVNIPGVGIRWFSEHDVN